MYGCIENTYRKYPYVSLITTISSAYAIYYMVKVIHKPGIFSNKTFKRFLSDHMPILDEYFKPTFWSAGAIPQTLLRTLLKSKPSITYRKEFLNLSDGGHVALDWMDNAGSKKFPDAATRPTVVLMPGLYGTSEESYMLHFAQQAQMLGYRCVVFNNRGNAGAELKTARTYCAANTEDLTEVIQHLKKTLPQAPLIAAGVSLGGIILANYLSRVGKESGLQAAFTVSMAWNFLQSADSLEQPVNHLLFNSHLCNGLKANVMKYKRFFESRDEYDLELLFKSTSIREFDDRFVAPQFGYASWREYYDDATMCGKMHKVRTPLLALNAADDPFAPEHSLPLVEAEKSSHVAMLVTKHGGHIGFLEGWFPFSTGYVDRVFAQYIQAVFENGESLTQDLNNPK